MPDYPTSVPAAGWYTDPGDPQQERWWGGVEWTHDVRPLQAAAAAPVAQPVLANVPGGGVNPFATVSPEPAGVGAGAYGPSFSSGASDFSSFNTLGNGDALQPHDPFRVDPSWYDEKRRPSSSADATNGTATVGLLLSIFGFNVIGVIVSAIALKKARDFEYAGDLPVGRKRGRWGVGLGVASIVIGIALTVIYLFAYSAVATWMLQQQGGTVVVDDPNNIVAPDDGIVVPDNTYDRASYEQQITDEYVANGQSPISVTCPDQGSTAGGSTIQCTIIVGDQTDTRTTTYHDDGSIETYTSTLIYEVFE